MPDLTEGEIDGLEGQSIKQVRRRETLITAAVIVVCLLNVAVVAYLAWRFPW